ncbi:MAG: corrinoid protein [Syntrophorhabdaceae bacterium]|nr:corrinoid protein [Syntrophorhabdaceae bacterium]MDD5244671.1 corrinoid protein [Syntrophorhabdaceae bacterium]
MASEERTREILKAIQDAVVGYDDEACERLCGSVLEEGIDPHQAIVEGLTGGMDRVGELYNSQEYFVPELLLCADALNAGLNILKPHLKIEDTAGKGKLLLGVVEGDIHDIGKNLVKIMFEAAGWEVYDLGNNVKIERFAEEQQKANTDIVALSALMTTSMLAMPKIIGALKAQNPGVKVLVGGAPLSQEIAQRYGADAYAPDAVTAVKTAVDLLRM